MHLKPDSVTEWRINQVALADGRTFSSAFAAMISEAWNHRMKTATAKAFFHGLPEDETAPPEGELSATISSHLDAVLISAVKKISKAENRSVSSTVGALIRDGLKARA
jgi:hypothetical protein